MEVELLTVELPASAASDSSRRRLLWFAPIFLVEEDERRRDWNFARGPQQGPKTFLFGPESSTCRELRPK